ncbi:hypothetical protein SAMD00019534_090260 [Acytostelium subglobosum LB1]|uniref:hypothetical protein n=1 Tax=Acytostelium subglobosum LB1 TaxID=1410327 RepID=UPI000644BC86|nr:hypothetical protein SAMD00019534_090260 [Acytostelium subglobosum LB1]GAM25851.1 hypothetical protein SAMD00019534_090260 [Acytostelium subglobosum LB1]|eukprot:XP_012751369.1 hypothetical protein SAMD00019534_090260 [Acytostelium subglobosum LB1]
MNRNKSTYNGGGGKDRYTDDNGDDDDAGNSASNVDLENQSLLLHPVNRAPDDIDDLEATAINMRLRSRSLLSLMRIFTIVLVVGYFVSVTTLFFVGNRIVFYPNPLNDGNSTDSSGAPSPIPPSMLDRFNFKYFFYFSTFDLLLLCFLLVIFWVVTLVNSTHTYAMVTYILTGTGLVYVLIKMPFAVSMLTQDVANISRTLLPINSPIYTNGDIREMTIITNALSLGLLVIYMGVNVYPLIVGYADHKVQVAKERKTLQEAEEQASSENRNFKRSTTVSNSNARRLAALSKPELPLIMAGMVALLFASFSSLAMPAFFGQIVQVVSTSKNINALNNTTLALVVIFVMGSISTMIRQWLFTLAGQRFVARMRKDLFSAIIKQDIAFFDQSRTGELVNRLASDTQVLQNTVTVNISMAVRYTIQVIGAIILLFITNWKLTLVMLGVIPVIIISAVFYGKKVKLLGKQFQQVLANSSTTGEEVISNIRTVKAFSKEDKFVNIYAKDVHQSYLIGKTLALASGIFSGSVFLVAQLAIVMIVYIGAKQVFDGTTTTGNLTSFLLYTLTVAMSLAFISSLFGDFMQSVGASDRIFELMDRVPAIPTSGGERLPLPVGEIELKDVDFTYPTRTTQVLKNINIKLVSGTVTALVGPSGGGKSTIVSLIERFYDPINGSITFDGVNIKTLDPRWYRAILGFVSQEPLLFAGTVKENISFGVENASMDSIIDAAKKANAHHFINEFEKGYDTVVGERGVRLSGGQKQRVAIARALLLNPKVLLLDEATSALDAESEYQVKEAIDRLMVNRTVLVIAHRLSTVVNATSVLVVNQGEIQERGTHDSLIKDEGGIYYNLVKRQLSSN